jgi:hypothetical protein
MAKITKVEMIFLLTLIGRKNLCFFCKVLGGKQEYGLPEMPERFVSKNMKDIL